jgi:hypothetical protein
MDPLTAVLVFSICIHVLGIAHFIAREIHVRDLNNQLRNGASHSVRTITSVTHAITELTKSIEREANLTRRERDDIIRLIVDVERRVTGAIRHNAPSVTVNDFNGDHAQVAQGERVNQK